MEKVYLKKEKKRKGDFLGGKSSFNSSVYLGIPTVKEF